MIEFTVATSRGPRTYPADPHGARRHGHFILHRPVDRPANTYPSGGNDGWQILHHTGWRVAYGFKGRAAARNCARELDALLSWDFSDPLTVALLWGWAEHEAVAGTVTAYGGRYFNSKRMTT